jgi:hypothetical protein
VRSFSLFLCCFLVACAPAVQVRPPSGAAVDGSALERRVQVASQRRDVVLRSAEQEDAPRRGRTKSVRVGDQLREVSLAAQRALPATPYREAEVRAYEEACARLEAAYLDSELESTDTPSQPGAWARDAGRDVLGSDTVDAKLAAWQTFDPQRPFAKFAVVRGESGALELRVGRLDVGHVDIAGGTALGAGLLQSALENGRTVVTVVENTSGGFRPGPLRNRTTRIALEAAGYLPADPVALRVHDNPTGGYDGSVLIPATKR